MSSKSNDRTHRFLALRLRNNALYDKTLCREITANYISHPVLTRKDYGGLHQDFTRISPVEYEVKPTISQTKGSVNVA